MYISTTHSTSNSFYSLSSNYVYKRLTNPHLLSEKERKRLEEEAQRQLEIEKKRQMEQE
jgi:hypothetical protein